MRLLLNIFFVLLVVLPVSLYANFSGSPNLAEVSAKYAKLKAKLRAGNEESKNTTNVEEANSSSNSNTQNVQSEVVQQVDINGADGCDLNVGNVLIDDAVRNPPDEIIIIIEGDIIQSNNCR